MFSKVFTSTISGAVIAGASVAVVPAPAIASSSLMPNPMTSRMSLGDILLKQGVSLGNFIAFDVASIWGEAEAPKSGDDEVVSPIMATNLPQD